MDIVENWVGFRNWAFRGQASAEWPLVSSLSRHVKFSNINPATWPSQEQRIRRIFERKAHLYLDDLPRDELEWLSLMQHHGAPTRLLDLSWSPYVAAFFALEHAENDAAVWAFNLPLIWQETQQSSKPDMRKTDPRDQSNYQQYYLPNKHDFVWQGDPFRMPRRVIAQSGTFLISGNLGLSIEEILESYTQKKHRNLRNNDYLLVKIVFDTGKVRKEAMASMYSMNITQATLFPDLDGLARSMAYEFEYSWEFDLQSNKVRPTLRDGRLPAEIMSRLDKNK